MPGTRKPDRAAESRPLAPLAANARRPPTSAPGRLAPLSAERARWASSLRSLPGETNDRFSTFRPADGPDAHSDHDAGSAPVRAVARRRRRRPGPRRRRRAHLAPHRAASRLREHGRRGHRHGALHPRPRSLARPVGSASGRARHARGDASARRSAHARPAPDRPGALGRVAPPHGHGHARRHSPIPAHPRASSGAFSAPGRSELRFSSRAGRSDRRSRAPRPFRARRPGPGRTSLGGIRAVEVVETSAGVRFRPLPSRRST